MTKKYEIFKTEKHDSYTLKRIRALRDFGKVKKGDIGGLIEHASNLSQSGNCWIDKSSTVKGKTVIKDNVLVCNKSYLEDYVIFKGNIILSNVDICYRISHGLEWEDWDKYKKPAVIDENYKLVKNVITDGCRAVRLNKDKNKQIAVTLYFDSLEQIIKFDECVENVIDNMSCTDTNNTFAKIYNDIINEPIVNIISKHNNELTLSRVKQIIKSYENKYKNFDFSYKGGIKISHKEFDIEIYVGFSKKGAFIFRLDEGNTSYYLTEKEFRNNLESELNSASLFE